MPTILGNRFAPDWAGRPPRMSAEDYEIWLRWWPTARQDARWMYFDVGLGLPDEIPQSNDAEQLLGWIRNTQKRADVIVLRERVAEVVELRFNATANVVGRLLLYLRLLSDDNPFDRPLIGTVVTNRPDSEVAALCASLGLGFLVA